MRLSLEVEINQFCLKEEGETLERPVELSDSEAEFDRFSAAHSPRLLVARVGTSSEEEVGMTLNPMRDLAMRKTRQPKLFLFLKRDLAMVSL